MIKIKWRYNIEKKVIFTIDVEGHIGTDPVDKLIYGNVDGKSYGIELIMDICGFS